MGKIGGKIAFLGSGNMAEAIFKGIISSGVMSAKNIICNDIFEDRLNDLKAKYGVTIDADTLSCVEASDVVVISVKPQNVPELLQSIKQNTLNGKLFISICAGVLSSTIEDALGEVKVVRVMPNTPAFIGQGFTGIAAGKYASSVDVDMAKEIFKVVGEVLAVEENMLDSVTAVSGSGPAYVFYLLESMVESAKKIGFSEEDAKKAVFATFSGALSLAKDSEDSLEILRKKVTSKGGTTQAALTVMEEENLMGIIAKAVLAAKDRSVVLSKG